MAQKITYLILLLCFSYAYIQAGKWNKPVYLDNGNHRVFPSKIVTIDSSNVSWLGIKSGFWLVNNDIDSISFVESLIRGNDTLNFKKEPYHNLNNIYAYIHGETTLLNLDTAIYYLTADSIVVIDSSHSVFNEFGMTVPRLENGIYYDSSYYFFITSPRINTGVVYPGLFELYERTKKFKHVFRFKNLNYFSELSIKENYICILDSFLIYPSEVNGYVRYNFNTDDTEYIQYQDIVEDSIPSVIINRYKDGVMHFISSDNMYYQLDLRTNEYKVKNMDDTPMYQNHKADTNYVRAYLEEINEKFTLYDVNIDFNPDGPGDTYGLYYILDSLGNWTFIDKNEPVGEQMAGPFISPDKERIWFYYYNKDGFIREDGVECWNYIVSYEVYAEPDDVEETDILHTLLPAKIYPNPAKKNITAEFFLNPHFRDKVEFAIYDYMGRKIKDLDSEYSYDKKEGWAIKSFNLEGISTGIYFLVIDNGTEKRSLGFAVD